MVLIDKWEYILLLGMKIITNLVDFKGFLLAGSAVVAFSHFVYTLFGYTIPEIGEANGKEFSRGCKENTMMSLLLLADSSPAMRCHHQR